MNNICSASAVIELVSSLPNKTREGVAKKWVKAQEAFPPNIPCGLRSVYQQATYWGKLTIWAEFRLGEWGLGEPIIGMLFAKAAKLRNSLPGLAYCILRGFAAFGIVIAK